MQTQTEIMQRALEARQASDEAAQRAPRGRSFWRVNSVASDWDVSPRTVWRYIADGRLKTVRVGRSRLVTDESKRDVEAELIQAAAA